MKKAIIYARIASSTQVDSDGGLEKQVKEIRKYCKKHKLQVESEFLECKSGNESNTPLKKLLKELNKVNDVSELVVSDLTRISRNTKVYRDFFKSLDDIWITLHLVQEPSFMTDMLNAFAKHDSQLRGEKIKAGIARKKQNGTAKTVRFTSKGRNGKKYKYEQDVVVTKSKARQVSK